MSGLKPFRDLTTGVISTVATLATAAAGVLGVLHETGYLKAGATPSPAAIAMPANVQPPNVPVAATNAGNAPAPARQPFAGRNAPASLPATDFQGAPPNQFRRHPGMRNPSAAPMDSALASNDSAREFAPRRANGQADQGAVPAQPHMVIVNGAWRDSGMGYCHVIKQDGAKLEVVNLAPVTSTFVSAGVGRVTGREVHLRLNVLKPAAANAELFLSDDGTKLVGTIKRPDGDHPTAWHRVGATCG
jgi:hypothetical protein